MASTIVHSNIQQPDLLAPGPDNKPVRIYIVGFSIDGGKAIPLTWPHLPGAPVFVQIGGEFRRFDLATGLASGETFKTWAEAAK